MHDIICPFCGERVIARSVSFDMTDAIRPLIDSCGIRDLRASEYLHYYTDEEEIISSSDGNMPTPDGIYLFRVTVNMIMNNICRRAGCDAEVFFTELYDFYNADTVGLTGLDKIMWAGLEKIRYYVFGEADTRVGLSDIAELLCRLYENSDRNMYLRLRIIFGGENNDIPDGVELIRTGENIIGAPKCCGLCGRRLPRLYGHYRMKHVVFMGNRSSGKTTALSGILYSLKTAKSFSDGFGHGSLSENNKPVYAICLTDDIYTGEFNDYISSYRRIIRNENTTEQSADTSVGPRILSVLFGNIIYVFIDFDGAGGRYDDLSIDQRHILNRVSHIFYFITPENLTDINDSSGINTQYNVAEALNSILEYSTVSAGNTNIRSVTIVAGCADKYNDDGIAELMSRRDGDICSESGWHMNVADKVNRVTEEYLADRFPYYTATVRRICSGVSLGFIPSGIKTVMRKGRPTTEPGGIAALPLLTVAYKDGLFD